jgi:hypothetical protein
MSRAVRRAGVNWPVGASGRRDALPPRHGRTAGRLADILPRAAEKLWRHAVNAGLLSGREWRRDPLGLLSRVIPLSVKEAVNRRWRPVFDLSFYLQFEPATVAGLASAATLDYFPAPRRGAGLPW